MTHATSLNFSVWMTAASSTTWARPVSSSQLQRVCPPVSTDWIEAHNPNPNPKQKDFLINGSKGRWNDNMKTLSCKNTEFMLRQNFCRFCLYWVIWRVSQVQRLSHSRLKLPLRTQKFASCSWSVQVLLILANNYCCVGMCSCSTQRSNRLIFQ